jgi:carbonic anhydrase
VRNAGNVVDETVLGSIEYGAEHLGSPLVVVIGHSCCGAVTAACEGGDLPDNIQSIVNKIAPSVEKGNGVDEVIHIHAQEMAEQVKNNEIIKHLGTKVLPAYYDIVTGEVKWL